MDKYRVALTVKERLALEQVVSIGKAAARKLTHARIVLLADERCGEAYADAEIVSALGTSPRTIEQSYCQELCMKGSRGVLSYPAAVLKGHAVHDLRQIMRGT